MEPNSSFSKKKLFNYFVFCNFLILNTYYPKESFSKVKDDINMPNLISFRSTSCGCCKKWVNHLRDNDLDVVDNILEDISGIKKQFKVPNNLISCHSAKIGNYIIEGHVPIESINKLFKEKKNISGLAVPGMPHGSPGMKTDSHESHSHNYEIYNVFSFNNSGKAQIFDKISP